MKWIKDYSLSMNIKFVSTKKKKKVFKFLEEKNDFLKKCETLNQNENEREKQKPPLTLRWLITVNYEELKYSLSFQNIQTKNDFLEGWKKVEVPNQS